MPWFRILSRHGDVLLRSPSLGLLLLPSNPWPSRRWSSPFDGPTGLPNFPGRAVFGPRRAPARRRDILASSRRLLRAPAPGTRVDVGGCPQPPALASCRPAIVARYTGRPWRPSAPSPAPRGAPPRPARKRTKHRALGPLGAGGEEDRGVCLVGFVWSPPRTPRTHRVEKAGRNRLLHTVSFAVRPRRSPCAAVPPQINKHQRSWTFAASTRGERDEQPESLPPSVNPR